MTDDIDMRVPVLDGNGEVIVFRVCMDRTSAVRLIRTGTARRRQLGVMFNILRDAVIEQLARENSAANEGGGPWPHS